MTDKKITCFAIITKVARYYCEDCVHGSGFYFESSYFDNDFVGLEILNFNFLNFDCRKFRLIDEFQTSLTFLYKSQIIEKILLFKIKIHRINIKDKGNALNIVKGKD